MSGAASGIEGLGEGGAFVRAAAERLGGAQFKLIDIGCAGGLAPGWRVFGRRLAALGIDGDAQEIERLAAIESNPNVRYRGGFVGLPDDHPLRLKIGSKAYWHHWPSARFSWERTFDLRRAGAEGLRPRHLQDYFDQEVVGQDWLTTPVGGFDLDYGASFEPHPTAAAANGPVIHLPDAVAEIGFEDVDFIKLDVDGPDFEVLRSIGGLLSRPTLLGMAIEVSFFGSHDANDNSFHNVDRLMREKGFDLFALSQRKYSSAALPWPYLDDQPGKTAGGRIGQGDAIYVRDFGSRVWAPQAAAVDDAKLLKAAMLLSLMDMHDWAAEVLIVHRGRLSRLLDVDAALDLLGGDLQAGQDQPLTHADYVARFEREEPRFFGAGSRQEPPPASAAGPAPEAALLEAIARAAELERRLESIQQSSSWRLTAPLRTLSAGLNRVLRRRY